MGIFLICVVVGHHLDFTLVVGVCCGMLWVGDGCLVALERKKGKEERKERVGEGEEKCGTIYIEEGGYG